MSRGRHFSRLCVLLHGNRIPKAGIFKGEKIMEYFENSFGTGCGKRHDRKAQHKKFRGRISRLLIVEGSKEYEEIKEKEERRI